MRYQKKRLKIKLTPRIHFPAQEIMLTNSVEVPCVSLLIYTPSSLLPEITTILNLVFIIPRPLSIPLGHIVCMC